MCIPSLLGSVGVPARKALVRPGRSRAVASEVSKLVERLALASSVALAGGPFGIAPPRRDSLHPPVEANHKPLVTFSSRVHMTSPYCCSNARR